MTAPVLIATGITCRTVMALLKDPTPSFTDAGISTYNLRSGASLITKPPSITNILHVKHALKQGPD